MSKASRKELEESIKELTVYRNRLKEEVVNVSRKLQMPQRKIETTLRENFELKKIEEILSKLISQRDSEDEHKDTI